MQFQATSKLLVLINSLFFVIVNMQDVAFWEGGGIVPYKQRLHET
jgi:hypothetical protein